MYSNKAAIYGYPPFGRQRSEPHRHNSDDRARSASICTWPQLDKPPPHRLKVLRGLIGYDLVAHTGFEFPPTRHNQPILFTLSHFPYLESPIVSPSVTPRYSPSLAFGRQMDDKIGGSDLFMLASYFGDSCP